LTKLRAQLAAGRGEHDAVKAFAQHSKLAYYAYLHKRRHADPHAAVRIEKEHLPWERFFESQGPHGHEGEGGQEAEQSESALLSESANLQQALVDLIGHAARSPELVETEEALLASFERILEMPEGKTPRTAIHGAEATSHNEL